MLDSRPEIVKKIVDKLQGDIVDKADGKNANPFLFARNITFSKGQRDIANQLITDLNGLGADQKLLQQIHGLMFEALGNSIDTAMGFKSDKWSCMSLKTYRLEDLKKLQTLDYDESLNIKPTGSSWLQVDRGDQLQKHLLIAQAFKLLSEDQEVCATELCALPEVFVTTLGQLLIDEIVKMKSNDVEMQLISGPTA